MTNDLDIEFDELADLYTDHDEQDIVETRPVEERKAAIIASKEAIRQDDGGVIFVSKGGNHRKTDDTLLPAASLRAHLNDNINN